jgi:hypothetical protein
VYDREYNGRTLEFETSGGLLEASLVMRDRETDSWWSIMTGDAIGGNMQGEKLKEMPVGEKATWGDWKKRHPNSLVLSVGGREHDWRDGYDGYFTSERTFRNIEIHDYRMQPKQPVFSFQHDNVAYAVAHETFAGGGIFDLQGTATERRQVVLFRDPSASLRASTTALLVPKGSVDAVDGQTIATLAARSDVERLAGFDTFWYNWVLVHPKTIVLE